MKKAAWRERKGDRTRRGALVARAWVVTYAITWVFNDMNDRLPSPPSFDLEGALETLLATLATLLHCPIQSPFIYMRLRARRPSGSAKLHKVIYLAARKAIHTKRWSAKLLIIHRRARSRPMQLAATSYFEQRIRTDLCSYIIIAQFISRLHGECLSTDASYIIIFIIVFIVFV